MRMCIRFQKMTDLNIVAVSTPPTFNEPINKRPQFNSRGTPFLTEHDCRRVAVDQFIYQPSLYGVLAL